MTPNTPAKTPSAPTGDARPDWAAYPAWKAIHLDTLLRMVAWASTPKEQRGAWER